MAIYRKLFNFSIYYLQLLPYSFFICLKKVFKITKKYGNNGYVFQYSELKWNLIFLKSCCAIINI